MINFRLSRWSSDGLSMGGVNNWDQNPRFPYRGGGIYFISKIIVFALTKMGVGASSTEVPITVEAITLLWRRFRHRDLAGSIRLDVLHVTVLFASRYAAYEGEKTPPLCLGSRQAARAAGRPGGRPAAARPNTRGCPPLCLGARQAARAAGLGGRSTRPSNSLYCPART